MTVVLERTPGATGGGTAPTPRAEAADGRPDLYLPSLDGLRLLAFLLVLIHHLPTASWAPLALVKGKGWVGVEMFFVISSFLFFHLFRAEQAVAGRIRIGRFFVRRLLRLYPLMVGFPLLMLAIYGAPSNQWLRFAGLALFVDNIVTLFKGYNNIAWSAHLWTLSFEFQVYAVLPFAFLLRLRLGVRRFSLLIAAVFAGCLALRLIVTAAGARHPLVWVTPSLHPDAVLIGLGLALGWFARWPAWLLAAVVAATAAYFFVWAPLPWESVEGAAIAYPVAALMCASLIQLGLRWPPLARALSWRPVVFFGSISFGLYVFHVWGLYGAGFIFARQGWPYQPMVDPARWALFAGLTLAFTLALAVTSYYCFERPFLRLKDRFATVRGR